MQSNLHQGLKHGLCKALPAVVALALLSSPVAAQSGVTSGCTVPSSIQPLFNLLNTLQTLAFVGGVAIGGLGLAVSGIMIAGPWGEDWVRRGKMLAKNTILGVVILASANMIVSFIISQLGPSLCT